MNTPQKILCCMMFFIGFGIIIWLMLQLEWEARLFIIVICANCLSIGLLEENMKEQERNPGMPAAAAMIITVIGLVFTIIADWLYNSDACLIYFTLGTAGGFAASIFAVIFFIMLNEDEYCEKPIRRILLIGITYFCSFSLLSWGISIFINGEFDNLPAKHQKAIVLKKKSFTNKGRTEYILSLKNENLKDDIEVDRIFYNNTREGDEIVLFVKPGFLGYEWISGYKRK
jgi:hypothetical protein